MAGFFALLVVLVLLVVLLLLAGFDFAAVFVVEALAVEDFAAEVVDSGLPFLLMLLGSPFESASITMDGAAFDAAALGEAVLGDAALG